GYEDALAVLGVKDSCEELGVVRPLLDAVAEDRLELGAREDVRAELVERVDIENEGQLLDERAVAPRDLLRGGLVVLVLAKLRRHRRHEDGIGQFSVARLPQMG